MYISNWSPDEGSLLPLCQLSDASTRVCCYLVCLLKQSALMLLVGCQEGHLACKNEWWGGGVVICLGQVADLHMAQLIPHSLSLASLVVGS